MGRSFEINGVQRLVLPDWNISDVINTRSTLDCTVIDNPATPPEIGNEIIVYTSNEPVNIGNATLARTSNATHINGTGVTSNVTRYETGKYSQGVYIEGSTTNLLSANQSDIETDTTGFTALNTATLTRITTDYWQGTACLQISANGSANNQGVKLTYVSASATFTYSFSFWVKGGTADITLEISGSARTTAIITSFTSTTAWTQYQKSFTADGTGELDFKIYTYTAIATTFYIDGLQLEKLPYTSSWIQGGTTRLGESLTIPNNLINKTQFTVECRVKKIANFGENGEWIFSIGDDYEHMVDVYSQLTGWGIRIGDGVTATTTTGGTPMALNTWYGVAARYDGTTFDLFINGVNLLTITSAWGYDTSLFYIGGLYYGLSATNQFNGIIDDFRISNIALEDAEILANYNLSSAMPVDEHTTAKLDFDNSLTIYGREILFGGTIDTLEISEDDPGYLYYRLSCVDYNQLADKRLYAASHTNTLAGNIISAIITAKLSYEGITAGSILDGIELSQANFNYDTCADSLNYIRDTTGYNWNIDYNKQLNFFSNATNLAPWTLNDSIQHNNFKINKTRNQYRNKQYIRAGTGKTSIQTLEKPSPSPDGSSRNFTMRFPVAEKPVVYINSTAVLSANVGVNGLDTGKQWYFTYESLVLSQDSGEAVLTAGTTLEITYYGLYPLMITTDNPAEIASRALIESGTSGVYETIQQEKSINEKSQAIEYSEGLIQKFGIIPATVTFETEVSGLRAGQLLPIQKTLFGITSSYLIESVGISSPDGHDINYSVKCLDGSALGGWEQFFKSILKDSKSYILADNEVIVLQTLPNEDESWNGTTTATIYGALFPLNVQRLGTETQVFSIVSLGGGIVLAGTFPTGGIYKSIDSGGSWALVQRLGAETYIESLVSLGGGIVIAGAYPGGNIYKSIDSGATWNLVQRLGTETSVWSLASLGGGIVLAGTSGEIYKSIDSGATWNYVQNLGAETHVRTIVSLGGGIVLAGTAQTGQIYKSIDSGATWNLVQRLGTEIVVVCLLNLSATEIIAGTYSHGGIYRSTDAGATWTFIQSLGSESSVESLVSLGSGVLLAGTSTNGHIYKSTNYGAAWFLIERLGTETDVYNLTSLGGGIVLAGTGNTAKIFQCLDSGESWGLYPSNTLYPNNTGTVVSLSD